MIVQKSLMNLQTTQHTINLLDIIPFSQLGIKSHSSIVFHADFILIGFLGSDKDYTVTSTTTIKSPQAIQDHAKENGYSVVRQVGCHGIGLEFHEAPYVSYVIKKGTGMVMAPGMVFTIEPMINMGTSEIYIDEQNGWTIYTDDEKPSAQWEIMVLVTNDGYEVMSW